MEEKFNQKNNNNLNINFDLSIIIKGLFNVMSLMMYNEAFVCVCFVCLLYCVYYAIQLKAEQ